jgi:capsular exopolysaccharide synthesis family protein
MGQLRIQQSELTRREAELRSKLGDRHAEVLAVAAQLAGLNKAMDDEARRVLVGLQNDLDIAVRREQSLEASLLRLTAAQSDSGDYVRMQQLQRLADADTKLYENYLSQYNEITVQASVQAVGARIIAPATVPTAPSFPNHQIVFYAGAGVLGLTLGVMLALLLEHFRPSIHNGSQAEQMFGYPVVGALPLLSQGRSGRGRPHQELIERMVSAPLSPFSEAIRGIRIGLHLSDRRHDSKVILVTSSLPGEGKSAVAMLLAASSAGARQRAVLVDCDLRGRAVSQNFGQRKPGLTQLLAGTADVKSVTIHDAVTGCFVIPAGTSGDVPADLLSTKRMDEVIDQLRNDFDFVVLDTPPLLSVVDALTLTPLVDKILLTIDSNAADCENIAEALRLLRPDANRIAGMVFNKLPEKAIARYRYGGYGYPYAAPASVTTDH